MRHTRLEDLAKILNVTKVTVSKALRDHPDISLEMKKKVRKVAKELGYLPNYIARNLSSKRTYTIGVVVPDIANIFFSFAIHGIIDYATEKGYQIILTVSREKDDIEKQNLATLLSMRVDGILISVSQKTVKKEIFEIIKNSNTPLIFFDREIEEIGFKSVVVDDFRGAFDGIEFLIKQGYNEIAYLGGSLNTSIEQERYSGYRAALEKHKIQENPNWIIHKGFNIIDGYKNFKELYNNGKLPQVIFTVNGHVAAGAYRAIKELGLKIPSDIGVMGFGFNEFTNTFQPPLTIMSENPQLLGSKAIDLLVQEIESPTSEPQKIVLPLSIEIHDSCKLKS
jgi:LacI family transcriptional regulator